MNYILEESFKTKFSEQAYDTFYNETFKTSFSENKLSKRNYLYCFVSTRKWLVIMEMKKEKNL